MEEQIITFKTAKLAKSQKFPQQCISNFIRYYDNNGKLNTSYYGNSYNCDIHYLALSQTLLQKWLRDKHNLHITIFSKSQESWAYRITKKGQSLRDGLYREDFNFYEDALEDALLIALNLFYI